MGCCQSQNTSQSDFKSEIVAYEKRDESSNIFEDQFYIDSVERYNVKYKPNQKKVSTGTDQNGLATATGRQNNAYINGGSGASGGIQNNGAKQ